MPSYSYADSLRDIYLEALSKDAKLKIAEATYKADQENEIQAHAQLLPQIGVVADYGRHRSDKTAQSISGISPAFKLIQGQVETRTNTTDRNWTVTLSQKIIDVPAWFYFRSNKLLSEQAKAQFSSDQQDLIMRTATAYFSVLRAIENLHTSTARELADKQQRDQSEQKLDVGLVAITDAQEARAIYDASIATRVEDEGNLAIAYEILNAITGSVHTDLWPLSSNFPVSDPEPNDSAAWVQFALKNNSALQAKRFAAAAAQLNAAAKSYENVPKVNATFSYEKDHIEGSQSSQPLSLFSVPPNTDSVAQSATVQVSIPIYSGGYINSVQHQANEQFHTAEAQNVDKVRSTIQEARAQFIAASLDVRQIKARAQFIVSAKSAFEVATEGYKVGTHNIVDLSQLEQSYYAAQRDYANSRYDYVLDTLRLKQQAGILNPQDIYDLNRWLIAPAT